MPREKLPSFPDFLNTPSVTREVRDLVEQLEKFNTLFSFYLKEAYGYSENKPDKNG